MVRPLGKDGPNYRYFVPYENRSTLVVSKKVRQAVTVYAHQRGMSVVEATFLILSKGFRMELQREDPEIVAIAREIRELMKTNLRAKLRKLRENPPLIPPDDFPDRRKPTPQQ